MFIACTYMLILVHNFVNMYKHVCTMDRALCTDLQILVHVVRIPDEQMISRPLPRKRRGAITSHAIEQLDIQDFTQKLSTQESYHSYSKAFGAWAIEEQLTLAVTVRP